ncbi:MAG TPA: ABC transporter substrate-binding protein, partial [Oceanipulchritudo sp.]|nr:ABC transporter substrate-binding protein [Oceanipulchritudo sp.]
MRWSPQGDPVVPHVARAYEIRDEGREYVFHLRKGMRWSDGHPFTADDILYWWEHEYLDPAISNNPNTVMLHRGETGRVEKIDTHTIRFRFEEPNGLFLQALATIAGRDPTGSPAHYLRPYHPRIGDPELIEAGMKAWQMPTPEALYTALKEWDNPEHPRLWPFLYRSYQSDPPFIWVRNPYYFAVDPEGNQLPYLDSVIFELKSPDLIPIAASNGDFSYQSGLGVEHYTILMDQRSAGGYEIYFYSFGGGSPATLFPNLTKRDTPYQRHEAEKEALMRLPEFRQALSLAINREAIIEVEYGGMTEAAQVAPGPGSPYFHEPLYKAFVDYDPGRANALLDAIGLTRRDAEGYRTFKDGEPMSFTLTYKSGSSFSGAQAEAIVEDWAAVGIRTIFRERGANLAYLEREGMLHDFIVEATNGQDYPILKPSLYVPFIGSFFAQEWGYWFARGGYYGAASDGVRRVSPPPEDHPLMEAIRIYDEVIRMTDPDEQTAAFKRILAIAAENLWTINISSPTPDLVAVKNGFRNVPRLAYRSWNFLSPANIGMETFYWESPEMSASASEQLQRSLLHPLGSKASGDGEVAGGPGNQGGGIPAHLRGLLLLAFAGVLLYFGIRLPYVGYRLLLMVPSLVIVSLMVFTIVQLPPGDYSTSLIAQAEAMGEASDLQRVQELKDMFLLEESWLTRYGVWSGLKWFFTFESRDRGLLQGHLGRSMETLEPVNAVIGDRLQLTMLVGFGTVLFTWVVALPIGIYSAVRQYSIGDYIFTFFGFLGMCIPNFLFALLLMYFSSAWLGMSVTGLFSPEYAAEPDWSVGKFLDLLAHLWIPVVVIGTAGTASMIRIMRSNLLDELKKPYVTTARAKGMRPFRLIMKYPVRLSLNPFISGLGHIFPQIISGGAIVALILSLPTL